MHNAVSFAYNPAPAVDRKGLLSFHKDLFAQNASTLTTPPPGVKAIRPPPAGTTEASKQISIPPYFDLEKSAARRASTSSSAASTLTANSIELEKEGREMKQKSGISRLVSKTKRRFSGKKADSDMATISESDAEKQRKDSYESLGLDEKVKFGTKGGMKMVG